MSVTGEVMQPPAVFVDEVDGVPLVWGSVEGPLAASLIFRVGRSDESLAWSGITHLVEHLALFREGLSGAAPHFNGQVDDLTTAFYLHGEPEEVTGFLSRVTTNLATLPMERLVTEREILRSEAANRSLGGGYLSLLRWRYGPRTYGLAAYEELGLHRLGAEDVEGWAARMFTRDNAVLMLSGPPPVGLHLNLGQGQRVGPVPASSALPQLPAWYQEGEPGASSLSTVPRSTAANALRFVVEQRLRSRLRYDLGASYSPGVAYEPRDATDAHLFVAADAVPEHAHLVRREIAQVLQEVDVDDVVVADLATWGRGWGQALVEPGARRGWVHTQAMDVLLERPRLEFDGWADEIRALEPEDVVAVARSAHQTSLVRLGGEFETGPADRAAAPVWSEPGSTAGRDFEEIRATPATATSHLVVGPDATAVLLDGPRRIEVRHDQVAAVLEWPDGKVTVIGNDAFSVQIDPRHWLDGPQAIADLRSRVSPEIFVPMPAREVPPVNVFPEPRQLWKRFLLFAGLQVFFVVMGVLGRSAWPLLWMAAFGIPTYRAWTTLNGVRRVRDLGPVRLGPLRLWD